MMNKGLMAMMASAAIVAGGVALAQAGDRGADRAERFFKKADANGDGTVTQIEATAVQNARFDRADQDGDGTLTLSELSEMRKKAKADRAARMFKRLDSDGNGVIARTEYEEFAARRFGRMDADGNGAVTLDEVKKARSRRDG